TLCQYLASAVVSIEKFEADTQFPYRYSPFPSSRQLPMTFLLFRNGRRPPSLQQSDEFQQAFECGARIRQLFEGVRRQFWQRQVEFYAAIVDVCLGSQELLEYRLVAGQRLVMIHSFLLLPDNNNNNSGDASSGEISRYREILKQDRELNWKYYRITASYGIAPSKLLSDGELQQSVQWER